MGAHVDYLLSFLAAGLLLFAAGVALAYVVVRVVFIRMAEKVSARLARRIDRQISLPLIGGIGLDAVFGGPVRG